MSKENCCCEKEKKEFCVVYTIEGEEKHVMIMAKDEVDAFHQVHNAIQLIISIFGLNVGFIVNRVYQEC